MTAGWQPHYQLAPSKPRPAVVTHQTTTERRIMVRKDGGEWLAYTTEGPDDHEWWEKIVRNWDTGDDSWEAKLEERTVVTETTAWEEVDVDE